MDNVLNNIVVQMQIFNAFESIIQTTEIAGRRSCELRLPILRNIPIKHPIKHKTFANKQVSEDPPQVSIVQFVIK